jgi:hypothetical protein
MSTLAYLLKLFFMHAGTFFLQGMSVPATYVLCFFLLFKEIMPIVENYVNFRKSVKNVIHV